MVLKNNNTTNPPFRSMQKTWRKKNTKKKTTTLLFGNANNIESQRATTLRSLPLNCLSRMQTPQRQGLQGPAGIGHVWVPVGLSCWRERLQHRNSFGISHGKSDIKHQPHRKRTSASLSLGASSCRDRHLVGRRAGGALCCLHRGEPSTSQEIRGQRCHIAFI